MGEKETMTGEAGRFAAPTQGGGPPGLAIGDQGTTENPHGGGGGGGGPSHGPLFPQGGELPTHPGAETNAASERPPEHDASDSTVKSADEGKKGPNAVNVKLA